MKLTLEQKKEIYTSYMAWCNQVADDIEDKTWFTAEELVAKVISLVEEVTDEQYP